MYTLYSMVGRHIGRFTPFLVHIGRHIGRFTPLLVHLRKAYREVYTPPGIPWEAYREVYTLLVYPGRHIGRFTPSWYILGRHMGGLHPSWYTLGREGGMRRIVLSFFMVRRVAQRCAYYLPTMVRKEEPLCAQYPSQGNTVGKDPCGIRSLSIPSYLYGATLRRLSAHPSHL